MKSFNLIFVALVLAPAGATAQVLPDDPAPAPPAAPVSAPQINSTANLQAAPTSRSNLAPFWLRVQQIANGEQVEVVSTYGPPLKCRFAGATDAYLFCDPPGSPEGTGYRFERATVFDVRVVKPPHNWHPGFLAVMIGGGLVVGLAASQETDAGHAAEAGFIGALATGVVAAPFALLPPPPPPYAIGAGVAFRPQGLQHRLRIFPPVRH